MVKMQTAPLSRRPTEQSVVFSGQGGSLLSSQVCPVFETEIILQTVRSLQMKREILINLSLDLNRVTLELFLDTIRCMFNGDVVGDR